MATLCANKDYIILSFSHTSIVLPVNDNGLGERMLEYSNSNVQEQSDDNDIGSQKVCAALSHNGEYFICCVHKDLHMWSTKDWHLVSSRKLNRATSAIGFSPANDKIAVADKSGDVFLYSVESSEKEGELILGHISMLLDVLISPNGQHIITCDRDEKVRVSCYPNAYNIQSFCLGHEEFVTCLNILPHNETVLISGSGDGTIRFWDYRSGKQLLSYSCIKDSPEAGKLVISNIEIMKHSEHISILCVQIVDVKGIQVYSASNNNNDLTCTFKQFLDMESEPWCIRSSGNCLWVLRQDNQVCLSAYIFCCQKFEFLLDDSLVHLKTLLQKQSMLVETVFKKETDVNALYKRRFDNVQEYLKRKMERIETGNKKTKQLASVSKVT